MTVVGLLIYAPAFAATYSTKSVGECAQVTRYTQPDGVEVTPGVDARGWAVAPPDAEPPVLSAEDFRDVEFGLNIPVGNYLDTQQYNLDATESDLRLGTIRVTRNGETTLDDRKLAGEELLVKPDCR